MDISPFLITLIEKKLASELDLFTQSFINTQKNNDHLLQEIHLAHAHPLTAGGKRIRPLLLLLTAGSLGGEGVLEHALCSAVALELIHTYSLVHDDLPCMDDDDMRRGKPTTHKIYGDAKALLVGDGLLTRAFQVLSQTPFNPKNPTLISGLVEILSLASGTQGMIWGQWLDLSYTNKTIDDFEILKEIHVNKTGKLLGAAFEMGFLWGISNYFDSFTADEVQCLRSLFRNVGITLGLSFQIKDDILDVTQTSTALGKTAAKDVKQDKSTAVKLLGLEKAQETAQMLTDTVIQELDKSLRLTRNILSIPGTYFGDEKYVHGENFSQTLQSEINNLLHRTN